MTTDQISDILVVDDEEGMRFTFRHYLVHAGYRVSQAANIEEAETMIHAARFDAAIIDRVLSNGQNGIHLLKTLHEIQPYCRAILVSAWPTFASAVHAMQHQVFGYLTKPVKKNKLLEMVDQAVNSGREQRMIHTSLRKQRQMEVVNAMTPGMVHDFNNLLTVMDGYAELLKSESGGGCEFGAKVDAITCAIARGRNLIGRMMHGPRSRSHQPVKFDLAVLFQDVLKLVRASIRNEHIALEASMDAKHGWIQGDPDQLFHAILNICINAIQAMQSTGGKLTVTLGTADMEETAENRIAMPGSCLKLTIRDTGPGMDPEMTDRIFKPFFTSRSSEKGTGLGLFMVEQTIKAHGGAIRVASAKGRGAEFTILLPSAGAANDRQPSAVPVEAAETRNSLTIEASF